jgi:hypothetical protein
MQRWRLSVQTQGSIGIKRQDHATYQQQRVEAPDSIFPVHRGAISCEVLISSVHNSEKFKGRLVE